MNAKVLTLVERVRGGFEITGIEDRALGGVRITLRRGRRSATMSFEQYELPAVVQECSFIGVAK